MAEDKITVQKKRVPRKITKQRLKNIGLYYLKRFESSVANLRSVLRRRVNDYAYYDKSYDKTEALQWIEEILADFERFGYLDDSRYSEIKIKSYIAAGKSPRYIQGKLKQKGIDETLAEQLMDGQEYDVTEACRRLAKKRKIGAYREDEESRQANRTKDLGVLVRAGFDYETAVSVLDEEAQ